MDSLKGSIEFRVYRLLKSFLKLSIDLGHFLSSLIV